MGVIEFDADGSTDNNMQYIVQELQLYASNCTSQHIDHYRTSLCPSQPTCGINFSLVCLAFMAFCESNASYLCKPMPMYLAVCLRTPPTHVAVEHHALHVLHVACFTCTVWH